MSFVKRLLLLLILLLPLLGKAQIITTVAGNGTPGYTGDGGDATAAYIDRPIGICGDQKGNIYFTESFNHIVRKIDTGGVLTTFAGIGSPGFTGDSGPATGAQLNSPLAITFDPKGNMYVVDIGNSRIRKIDTAGIITTIAGNGTSGYNGDSIAAITAILNNPLDIASDTTGNIYIADLRNYRIRKIDIAGVITTIGGNGTAGFSGDSVSATAAQMTPLGIATDKQGNIFISDSSDRVRKINRSGIITTIAGTGISGYSGDNGAAVSATLSGPRSLAVNDSEDLFISDIYNTRIRKINNLGIITTFAGNGAGGYNGDGGLATAAQVNSVKGLFAMPSGKIYFSDEGNYRVRCIGCRNSMGLNDLKITSTSRFLVMGNPTHDGNIRLMVKSLVTISLNITISNALGNIVKKIEGMTNTYITTDFSIPPGVYYVKASTSSGIFFEKIVIE